MGWIGFLTLVLPWLVWRGIDEPFLAPKLLAWIAGCWGLVLTTWFGRERQVVLPCRPALAFGAWVVAMGLVGFYAPYLLRPVGQAVTLSGNRWLGTVSILTALASWHALSAYVVLRPCAARLTAWCCWTACAMAIYQGIQALGLDQLYTQDLRRATQDALYVYRPYAGLGNIQFVAMTQALTLPLFFLFRGWRYLVMLALVVMALALSQVRFAQATALLTLFAYGFARAWHRWPRWRWLCLSAAVAWSLAGGVWAWRQARADERWIVWSEVVYQWRQPNAQGRPMALTGHGVESFRERFWVTLKALRPQTVERLGMAQIRWDTAHNDALQALYELGLIGFALAAWLALTWLWRGWRQAAQPVGAAWWASGAGLLAVSCVYFPWQMAQSAWFGSLIIVMNLRQPTGGAA